MVAALLLTALTGCSSSPEEDSNPYAQEFAAARQQTDVDEVLDALRDDVVSDAEYAQIQQLTIDCLADMGLTAEIQDGNSVRIIMPDSMSQDEVDAAYKSCADSRVDLVSPLYWDVKANPEKEDWSAVWLECYKRFGLVEQSMTIDEFKAIDLENPPWDRLSGDAYGCDVDPHGYSGGRPDLEPGEEPKTFEGS